MHDHPIYVQQHYKDYFEENACLIIDFIYLPNESHYQLMGI